MSLSDFITYVRRADNIIQSDQRLTDDLIEEAISDALDYYSLCRPRENRRAEVSIAIDDESIALPDDFLMDHADNESTLFLLTYGYEQPTYRVPGAYPLQRSGALSSFDSALGSTTDPPGSGLTSVPTTIPKSTDDSGNPILTLSDPATEAISYDILYKARHVIRDAAVGPPAVTAANTVPREDRALLRRLTFYFMAEARERQLALEGDVALSARWGEICSRYAEAKEEAAAAVGFGIW